MDRGGPLRRSIAGSILAGALILCLPGLAPGSSGAVPAPANDAGTAGPAYSQTKTLTRTNPPVKGQTQTDSRTVTVTVSQTQNLRERQVIDVTWSGAHPTGGIGAATTDPTARFQEYPVMVVECRGQDSTSVPAAQQVTPQTCWTGTPQERVFETGGNLTTAVWMQDRYASAANRAPLVGIPSPLPAACGSSVVAPAYWLHFASAGGTDYPIGDITPDGTGCAGNPPEMTNALFQQSLEPTNTTYGIADSSGNGSTKFVVSTDESNASLGCSATVPCTLEVIPIMGLSCDPAATGAYLANCSTPGDEAPGSESAPGSTDGPGLAVQGTLWWSASNWQGRFAVPLTFAPSAGGCSSGGPSPLDMYGSELMIQATQQWEPYFCSSPSLFPLQHVQTSDVEAKNLLNTGGIEAAIQGEPPSSGFATPTVQAPIGVSGFAIGYSITYGNKHTPYHQLELTPRLLAKLLTESYPEDPTIQSGDPGLAKNPLNILEDPEFEALNPLIVNSGYPSEPPATLYLPSADEDAMAALTSYINSDPDARAWLNGSPDPWGMTVNPAYKGIQLPVTSWPLLDTYASGFLYTSGNNQCLQVAHPVPYLSLVASPVSSMEAVSLNLQFTINPSQTGCGGVPGALKLVSQGPESPSFNQWQMSLVPLGDVYQYEFDTAALQTEVSAGAASKFADAGGRTFVAPSATSLQSAAALLTPNQTEGSWDLPYSTIRAGGIAAAAYPGTMLMSLDVPVSGLPAADAQDYAKFLQFAATTGQTPGSGVGQIPAGFLPMTAANGLGPEAAYTVAAAQAVAAQSGTVPPLIPPPPAPTTTTTSTTTTVAPTTTPTTAASTNSYPAPSSGGGESSGPTGSGPATYAGGSGSGPPRSSAASGQGPSPGPPGPTSSTTMAVVRFEPAVGRTPSIGSGLAGLAFPIALLCGLVAAGSRLAVRLLGPRGRR